MPDAFEIDLPSEADTAALGAALARALRPGDLVTVSGTLGAGKSVFARGAVRALLDAPAADVPSPSYTLVNVYDTGDGREIWHADLYRLGEAAEAEELGLLEALSDAILIVEWPDRLGALLPARRLEVGIEPTPLAAPRADAGASPDGAIVDDAPRLARLRAHGTGWQAALDAAARLAQSARLPDERRRAEATGSGSRP